MTVRAQGGETDSMKEVLLDYLRSSRSALMWKLEGLSERDLRLPRTPTGMNLLGIVKHMAQVEIGYLGETFGRSWPHPAEVITMDRFDSDPQADWYATEDESAASICNLYRRVWAFADDTIGSLPLDAQGSVPHWPAPKNAVTLQQAIVHVLVDLCRHLGQADIVREGIDGRIGRMKDNTNIPDDQDWNAYVAKLTALAERSSR